MSNVNILQFVCFTTQLGFDDFFARWMPYAKQSDSIPLSMTLQQEACETNRYKYISWQECPNEDFNFAFMKGNTTRYFPERNVKVVQLGGYIPIQINCRHARHNDIKVMVLISQNETDIGFYNTLPCRQLNIYQAFYESCTYSYILEFFIAERNLAGLVELLKTRTGTETALYKECPVPVS